MQDATFPQSPTIMRSFFGACNFYRRFAKTFEKIAAPLSDILKKVYRVDGGPPNSAAIYYSRRSPSGYCTRQCRAHTVLATCLGLPTHCTRALYVWNGTSCRYSCQRAAVSFLWLRKCGSAPQLSTCAWPSSHCGHPVAPVYGHVRLPLSPFSSGYSDATCWILFWLSSPFRSSGPVRARY